MTAPFPQRLRELLHLFIEGAITLREFYNEATPEIFTIERYHDPDATAIGYELIHYFAEFDQGD